MPDAPIALDALEALEVHADFAAQITFDHVLAILDGMNDLGELLLRQILRANPRINVGASQNVLRIAGANPIDVAQSNVDAFIGRNFYSDDASHVSTGLMDYWIDWSALPLFVPGVGANDTDDAFASNDFAILTKLF